MAFVLNRVADQPSFFNDKRSDDKRLIQVRRSRMHPGKFTVYAFDFPGMFSSKEGKFSCVEDGFDSIEEATTQYAEGFRAIDKMELKWLTDLYLQRQYSDPADYRRRGRCS